MNTRHLIGAALAAATLAAAAPALADDGRLHPVVGIALTGGGKTLVEVDMDEGPNRKISSGGLTQLFAGVEQRVPGSAFGWQATIGYHFDRVDASNGTLSFSRYPLELLGFWHANDSLRLGGGLRKALGSRFEASGAGAQVAPDANMRSSVGLVLQGEYLFGEHASVFLRFVSENYKSGHLVGGEVTGDHGGLGFAWRF